MGKKDSISRNVVHTMEKNTCANKWIPSSRKPTLSMKSSFATTIPQTVQ